MTFKVFSNMDLNSNQMKNAVVEQVSSDPPGVNVEGRMVYNTTTKTIMIYSNGAWKPLISNVVLTDGTGTGQVRNIHVMSRAPTDSEGYDGDLWIDSTEAPAPTVSHYAAVQVDQSVSDPLAAVSYPQTVTVGGQSFPNSCYGFQKCPSPSTGGTTDWWTHWILEGIKPVSYDGITFTDVSEYPSDWPEDKDIFVQFPFRGLRITTEGDILTVVFSDNPELDEGFSDYAFLGLDGQRKSHFFIGAFDFTGSKTNVGSKVRGTYVNDITIAQSVSAAQSKYPGKSDIMTYYQRTYLNALFLLLFKSTDGQVAMTKGFVSGSAPPDQALVGPCHHGTYDARSTGTDSMSFLWIWHFWGGYSQWCGGLYTRGGKVYAQRGKTFVSDTMADVPQTAQEILVSDTLPASGTISKVVGTNAGGFLIKDGDGSKVWSDYGNVYSGTSSAYFARVGGSCGSGDYAGPFYCNVDGRASYHYTTVSARLSLRVGRA